MVKILHLYISPSHNYFGHHGKPPGDHPMVEVDQLVCHAGKGIKGDRFYDYKPDYKGQITFFDYAVHEQLMLKFSNTSDSIPPHVYRRNVITQGWDLNALIGTTFSLQGISFSGVEECRPCYWMDQALAPGAEQALRGRGGLRARILTDGLLRRDG
jgi:MOSC domain-containing protein YiiM